MRAKVPWLAALIVLTGLRLLVAARTPLAPDEAYYWTWSHALAPGFLDHPPMTALWIRLGTLLFGDTPLGVRLLSPLAAGVGSVLLVSAGADLLAGDVAAPERYGRALVAAVLLNATLLLGVGAVTITPDTPLLLFWTAALASLARVIASGRGAWWLAFGINAGLALDSKYTVVLPAAGVALWLAATPTGRQWLRTPWPWAAALIALLLFVPVLAWNASHGWASLLKQGGRGGAWHAGRAARYLAELLGGQVGLATPITFILFVVGIARLSRRPIAAEPGATLLVWVTVPAVLVFVAHALGDRVQANWPGLLYPAGAIAAARLPRAWWRQATALGFGLTALLYLQSVAAPAALPRRLDITLVRLAGWQDLADRVAARAGEDGASDRFIIADEYGLAAELAFALPHRSVFAAEPRWRLFSMPHPDLAGRTGLLLRSLRRRDEPDRDLFADPVPLGELSRGRSGETAETYRLYRVTVPPHLLSATRDEIVRLPSPRP